MNDKILKKSFRENKLYITLIIIVNIISTILTIIAPVLVGNIMEEIVNYNIQNMIKLIGIIAVVYICIFLLDSTCVNSLSKLSGKIGENLRDILFKKLQKLSISYIDKNRHGELVNKFVYDAENISLAVIQASSKIVVGIVTILGSIIIMVKLNLIMAVITVLSAPLMYFISKFVVSRTKKMFKENANLVSELNGYTQEIINGNKTVKDFNYTKIVENNFKKINKKLYESGKKTQFYSALTNPSTRFVNNITYIIIGIIGIVLIKKGQTDLGILTSFLMYVNVFARPFNEITGVMSEIQTASSSYNKIKEFLRCG